MNSFEQLRSVEKPAQERRELFRQIDRGVRWNEIPVDEAIVALTQLKQKHLEEIPNKLEICFNLLDEIDAAVDQGIIPENEEVEVLRLLKEKFLKEETETAS